MEEANSLFLEKGYKISLFF